MNKDKYLEDVGKELTEAEQFNVADLEVGQKLGIQTENTFYTLEKIGDELFISGNPKYCPQPTRVESIGSTAGGRAIMLNKIVVGGRLELVLPDSGSITPITTSQVDEFGLIK